MNAYLGMFYFGLIIMLGFIVQNDETISAMLNQQLLFGQPVASVAGVLLMVFGLIFYIYFLLKKPNQ